VLGLHRYSLAEGSGEHTKSRACAEQTIVLLPKLAVDRRNHMSRVETSTGNFSSRRKVCPLGCCPNRVIVRRRRHNCYQTCYASARGLW